MSYDQVLELAALKDLPNVYVLGVFARRVTFFSQQARAINLIDALQIQSSSLGGKSVALVGAGAAGVTAAARALRYKAKVTLFEQTPGLLSVQSPSRHRWIHPSIYDWPFSAVDPADDQARLPEMDWSATDAKQLAAHLAGQFNVLKENPLLTYSPSTQVIDVGPGSDNRVRLAWKRVTDKQEESTDVDLAIFAVGFGLEPYSASQNSYWEGDPIDNTARGNTSVLVVGYGDGALTDLMRACLLNFNHDMVFKRILELTSTDEILGKIQGIEMHPRSGVDSYLTEKYLELDIEPLKNYLDGVRNRDRKVALAGAGPHFLSARSCALNRLIVSQLHHLRAFEHVAFDVGKKITADDPAVVAKVTEQMGKKPEHILLRFGPKPVIDSIPGLKAHLPDLRSRWGRMRPSEDLSKERLWESPVALIPPGEESLLVFGNGKTTEALSLISGNAVEQLRLSNVKVRPVDVDRCFTSHASLLQTAAAACTAPLALFALGPETGKKNPGGMLLLGIRSAVRRGVTLVGHNRKIEGSDFEALPFDLRELQVLALTGGRQSASILAESLSGARMILGGDASSYRDTPVFDTVRRTERRTPTLPSDKTEVFAVCSFSKNHRTNLWDVLQLLIEDVERLAGGTLRLRRATDYVSPLLVGERLYELIRFAGLCLVDLSEWRSNVLFELGVRLAVHPTPPICVIQESDLATIHEKPEIYRKLVQLLRPIPYPTVNADERKGPFQARFEAELERRMALRPSLDTVYNVASRHIDLKQERHGNSFHETLVLQALRILGPDVVRAGRIPLLYGENRQLTSQAVNTATEVLWSAYLLIQDQLSAAMPESEVLADLTTARVRVESLLADLLDRSTLTTTKSLRERLASRPVVNDSGTIAKVAQLQRDARQARKREDLKTAENALTEAIKILKEDSGYLQAGKLKGPDSHASGQAREIAELLADSLGSLAGIYRRSGKPAEALSSYKEGMDIEKDDRFRVTSSYNRVQWLVISILENPKSLAGWEFKQNVRSTQAVLLRQNATTRVDDPWALADLGLVALLAEDDETAFEAFELMKSLNPVSEVYSSGLPVIEKLSTALPEHAGLRQARDWYVAQASRS